MALHSKRGDWRLNKINTGSPYCVEIAIGEPKFAQVTDSRGTVALSNWIADKRTGAVFTTITKAKRLCALANAGRLAHE